MKDQRYVVLDLETTGNSPKKGDKIIQIAAVVVENGQIVDRYMSFVNPLQRIPLFIEQLTGITNSMVENAPTFEEIAHEIIALLDESFFVAHNVYFDLSFLQEELKECGFQFSGQILDTVELARLVFPTENSYKLSDLSVKFNMIHENPHRADSDAEATALLFIRIFNKIQKLPLLTLQQLIKLSRSFISDIEEELDFIISEKLMKLTGTNRPDLETVRSLVIKKIEEKNAEVDSTKDNYSFQQLLALFKNQNGQMTEAILDYHVRPEQLAMMSEVNDALNTHQHGLIEAPTGSGKTIGYLVPAFLFSKQQNKNVIVSTYTTHLQTQMIERDIPFLQKILPFDISAAILKGQSHYLCLQKFEQSLHEREDNYDFILSKAQLLIWLTETETGDVDELNLPSGGRALWEQLHVDRSSFKNNPFSSYCFYQRAKEKAQKANIIITNHAMLLSDLERKDKTLPSYEEVIIDEAHHLNRVASEQVGLRLSYLDIHNLLNRLGLSTSSGLVKKFNNLQEKLIKETKPFAKKLDNIHAQLQEECHLLFSGLHAYVNKRRKDPALNRSSYKYETNQENNRNWNSLLELVKRVQFMLNDYQLLLQKWMNLLDNVNVEEMSIKDNLVIEEFKQQQLLLKQYKNTFEYLFFDTDDSSVKWIEIDSKGAKNAVSIYAQPIEIADYLADEFFAQKQSVILTSATLTIKNSFSYMIESLGLNDFFPKKVQLTSSFPYKEQVKLFIPTDMPIVNEVTTEEYAEAIAANIRSVAQIIEGKILVLFTSFEMLRKTYYLLKDDVTLEDFVIMGQGTGSGSPSRITKNFRQYERAILLGTNSFWEGVDFPGDDLKALMIVRLPFASPDEPIVSAKNKRLESQGKNPFYDYSLPEAILRFKQGFGRLIRNETDKGILFILDNRMITTRYGKEFLSSIPELKLEKKPMHELTHLIEDWTI
ncbi:ATP-dependent DNA helicase DinG [Metabacillus litoralis]|uniref:ATP-dependent DNA helicase DinG n=1 Tax=Metabacillus litoralis TaxID=152268 RepID=UPI001CFD946A|nr:ATP-dependent DNA helicase DinG [Metabacillus litoralis]